MVECLIRDRGAAGSSLTSATVLCHLARTLTLAQYWFNPGRHVPLYLKYCQWDVKNQIKQTNNVATQVLSMLCKAIFVIDHILHTSHDSHV